MRLKLLILSIFIVGFAYAQTPSENPSIPFEKISNGLKGYDMSTFNRPKRVENPFESDQRISGSETAVRSGLLEVEPIGQLEKRMWGEIQNLDTGGEVLYASERIGNEFHVTTYNNDIEVVEDFSITVPANANQTQVINHYSTNFFSPDGLGEFLIYVHYFDEDIPGPEGQIWEIWAVNANGEVLQKLNGFAAIAKKDAEGNHRLYTYFEDEYEQEVIINAFDATTWEITSTYDFSWTLINYFMGKSFDLITLDGQEYVVIAHYKSLFMDNMTLEVFPDNNLMIKLLDMDLQEVKTISLDIETRFPEAGEFTIPMAQFGMFYRDGSYDISKDIFNADDNIEIVYGIYYYDMIADNEWSTFLVANEEGEVIHELNEYIIDVFSELNSIEGHDNQLGFLMGEDGNATSLAFFNIESWSFDHIFEAVTDGDQISADFNRVARGEDFNYLIGLGEPDEINGNMYGVIGEYNRSGTLEERHQFLIPESAILFTPVLTRYALTDQLFMAEDELYFMYVYKEMDSDGKVFNNVVISKDADAPLVEFRGDSEKGNIVGSTFLTNGNSILDKMTIQYEIDFDNFLTDVYQLPFGEALAIETPVAEQFSFYPNPTDGKVTIASKQAVEQVYVYDLLGKLVAAQKLDVGNQLDFTALKAGIYIATITFEDGKSHQTRFIKR